MAISNPLWGHAGGQAQGRGSKRSASLQLSSSLAQGTSREEVIQQGTHEQTHPRQPQRWTPSPGSASPALAPPGLASPAGVLQQAAAGDSAAPRQRPHSSSDEDLVSAQEGTPSEEADEEGESVLFIALNKPCLPQALCGLLLGWQRSASMPSRRGKHEALQCMSNAARQDAAVCAPALPLLQALPSPGRGRVLPNAQLPAHRRFGSRAQLGW